MTDGSSKFINTKIALRTSPILNMSGIFRVFPPNLHSGSRTINFYYWRNYKASLHAQNALPVHRVALEKRWNEREQAGIWSMVVTPLAVCSKATIRRHHARRLREAFKEALRERGLDEDGKAIDGQAPSLQGTLHIVAQPAITQAEASDLRKECSLIVSKIVDFSRKENVLRPRIQNTTRIGHNNIRTHKYKAKDTLGAIRKISQ
jgi:hypothetical protein